MRGNDESASEFLHNSSQPKDVDKVFSIYNLLRSALWKFVVFDGRLVS